MITWSSKKQEIIALSTREAEYVSVSTAACQTIWLRIILVELQQKQTNPTDILFDNMGAVCLTNNSALHGRKNYIDLRFH